MLASGLALVLVLTGLVYFAVQAEGFRSHQAELHDGGIWVTNGRDGFLGRVNKPIGQLDDVLFEKANSSLGVLQDGSSVVGVNYSAGTIAPVDPATVSQPDGQQARISGSSLLGMRGGTLAALDPGDGKLWAQRLPEGGLPGVSALDQHAEPLTQVGGGAVLAVAADGTVLVASAADDTLTRLATEDAGFDAPEIAELPMRAQSLALTAVGGQAVALDPERGRLALADRKLAGVPPGAVLQEPGGTSDAVVVATSDALLSVSLTDGTVTRLGEGVSGRPVRPVRIGDCVYGAWSGGGGYVMTVCGDAEPQVSSLGTTTRDLVFRVNHGEVLLNDRTTGSVWNVDTDQPARLDNWDAFRNKVTESDKDSDQENEQKGEQRPPRARPDSFGARTGRTTVLHPLDNDSAPSGRILSIRSVRNVRGKPGEIKISPSGQTLQVSLPDASSGATFEYSIDDGRQDVSDRATVTVTARNDRVNQRPHLRKGFQPRTWTVPVGGELDIPVLPDWRDNADGDPLAVVKAVALGGKKSGARALTTASGRIRFHAPGKPGRYQVEYAVGDGRGPPVTQKLEIEVQAATDRDPVPAEAQPDVVSGRVGEPITVRPLGNDLPGSDPITPNAELELGGKVASPGGTQVRTDLVEGTVTLRSMSPGTYFLHYDAAYGNAPPARGKIRVDVRAPKDPREPVAMPDTLTLHGQAASTVDVLANDVDPAGGLLTVQRATPVAGNQLDVAVVDGRWLRVSARQGRLVPNPTVVRYTVSNGETSGIQGELVVSQRPAPKEDTPVTETDRVTVRAGGTIRVPVLDNDHSPSGGKLQLVKDVIGSPAGELRVRRPGDKQVPTGSAFVEERFVRYVAPRTMQDSRTFSVRYEAANTAGVSAPGTLEVTVIPRDRPNQPPTPPTLEGRVVAGDGIRLELPGVGTDPDGDAVTVTGLESSPRLGRVVRVGANSLEYRAFPGASGTDEFTYTVADGFGGTATGTVRIVVAPPGLPQSPMAVDDPVTVAPGRDLTVDVLANDVIASGDRVTVELVDAPRGAKLESEVGPLHVPAPADADGRNTEVVYRISNGIDSSTGVVTVRARESYNNPPVVFDAFGNAEQGDAVKADVLATAYDPDGDHDDLRVTDVFTPPGVSASVDEGTVTISRSKKPKVVPFRVEDADGGAASAAFYVPPLGGGAPYVKEDARITLDPGDSETFSLEDYVRNPTGGSVSFTLSDRVWAAPRGSLQARITDEGEFEVSAPADYRGPGTVSFEVTTGTSLDDPGGKEAVLSIPVQVGETKPVLTCPQDPIEVYQGGRATIDVASVCHVWTADRGRAGDLEFTADWKTGVDGLSIVEPRGQVIELAADGDARPDASAVLQIRAGDSEPVTVPVRVRSAPEPSLAPIRIADMKAGEQRTIDLATYLRAGIPEPDPTLLQVQPTTGLDVSAKKTGPTSLRFTTGPRVDGTARFEVVMSDVSDPSGPERRVKGTVELEVLDRPDAPSAPVPGRTVRSQEVYLEWRAPDANGAPIDYYEVRSSDGQTTRCPTTNCEITGLVNGRDYTFRVRAHNAVGWSGLSPVSASATLDAKPGIVGPIQQVRRGDQTITIRWTKPTKNTSPIRHYWVTWRGGEIKVTRPQATVSGLDNNQKYTFSVQAENDLDVGPIRKSAPMQSIGPPGKPPKPTVADQDPAGGSTAVRIDWSAVNPNGPTPVRYTVLRDGKPLTNCRKIKETECSTGQVKYDGTEYTYSVVAINDNGQGKRTRGPGYTWSAVGQPAEWGDWTVEATGSSGHAELKFSVPESRGADSTVALRIDGGAWKPRGTKRGNQALRIGVGGNDGPHSVQLRVCNESGACSTSGTKSVQTYGPLVRRHIVDADPQRSSSGLNQYRVRWTVTLDANGNAARVRFRSCGGGDRGGGAVSGPDKRTMRSGPATLGPGQRDCLKVTLYDNNPNRGSTTQTFRSPRTPPRERIVDIRRGTRCQGASCGGGGTGRCTHRSCGKIQFKLRGFKAGQVQCRVYETHGGQGRNRWATDTVAANGQWTEPGPFYGYPDGTVWARCGSTNVKSNDYNWPNQ